MGNASKVQAHATQLERLSAHRLLVAWLALALSAAAIQAEVIELEGTIKAVDAAKREVTIGRKTLDVAKKCRITIDGQEVGIENLKPDQEATVEYDSELEIAKSITVGDGKAADDAVARA